VIDFTAYSDTALYKFFEKTTERVCGRFLDTQVDRPISIPYQPHSRLYRISIALGLTLLFTQTPHLLAQSRPPIAAQRITNAPLPSTDSTGNLRGVVLNNLKEQLPNVTVQIFQVEKSIAEAKTNQDGYYLFPALPTGYYTIVFNYPNFSEQRVTGVIVIAGLQTTQNMIMGTNQKELSEPVITNSRRPLVDGSMVRTRPLINDNTEVAPIPDSVINNLQSSLPQKAK